MSVAASATASIPETSLGLTQSELIILRQANEVATQQSRAGSAAMADRGRGTSRHSQPSSRNASAASSHSIQGRIPLDSNNLARIENALSGLIRQIQDRISYLEEAIDDSVASTQRGAANTIKGADEQILKAKKMIQEMDKLDAKLEEVNSVCEKVRALRKRVDKAGGRMDNATLARHGLGSSQQDPRRR